MILVLKHVIPIMLGAERALLFPLPLQNDDAVCHIYLGRTGTIACKALTYCHRRISSKLAID